MNISNFLSVDYNIINKAIKSGKKLRFDIGTSISAPVSRFWLNNLSDIFIIGVEPNPDCVEKENFWNGETYNIKKMFLNHSQKDCYYHIIGACDNIKEIEKQQFYLISGNVGCSSLLQPKIQNIVGCSIDKIITVDTFSLDLLLENINFDLIELIKVDTQGKDLDIMKGLKNNISKVCYIDLEDDSTNQYHNAASREQIVGFMIDNGFKLYDNIEGNLRFVNLKINIPLDYNNISGDM